MANYTGFPVIQGLQSITAAFKLSYVGFDFDNGSWNPATKELTSANAFSNYTYAHGDTLLITGGTGVNPGRYIIDAKVNNNTVRLVESISSTPATDVKSVNGGEAPFILHASAHNTQAVGVDNVYCDLEYSWNFGDANNTDLIKNPVTGKMINPNTDQVGPEAIYYYKNPGTYIVTLKVRGWDGSKFVENVGKRTVKVVPWQGQTKYFDSTAPAGGDGTIEKPHNSGADIWIWLLGGNRRRALLKAGSKFNMNSVTWDSGVDHYIGSYGSGDKPELIATSTSGLKYFIFAQASNRGNEAAQSWLVFDGVKFVGNNHVTSLFFTYRSDNGSVGPAVWNNIYVLNCHVDNYMNTVIQPLERGTYSGYYNCYFDAANFGASTIYQNYGKWFFVFGTTIARGDALTHGDIIRDHHIYPSTEGIVAYKYLDFVQGYKGFCLNINGSSQGKTYQYFLVDSCRFTGAVHGVDFGNANNNVDQGQFDNVIVQNCKFHLPRFNDSVQDSIGVSPVIVKNATIRDNYFSMVHNDIYDYTDRNGILNLKVYRCRFYKESGSLIGKGGTSRSLIDTFAKGYFKFNTVFDNSPADNRGLPKLTKMPNTSAVWTVDNNKYYYPNDPQPFSLNNTRVNFETWKSQSGLDANSTYGDPGWTDPRNGVFGDEDVSLPSSSSSSSEAPPPPPPSSSSSSSSSQQTPPSSSTSSSSSPQPAPEVQSFELSLPVTLPVKIVLSNGEVVNKVLSVKLTLE